MRAQPQAPAQSTSQYRPLRLALVLTALFAGLAVLAGAIGCCSARSPPGSSRTARGSTRCSTPPTLRGAMSTSRESRDGAARGQRVMPVWPRE
jgi:hypothetical protein